MCVCAYPYKDTNTCIHARIVHACVRADIHEHQHTYMHKHTHTHTHTHIIHTTCIHTYMHAHISTYIHAYKHTYARERARTHTHTHVCTHTDTHKQTHATLAHPSPYPHTSTSDTVSSLKHAPYRPGRCQRQLA